MTTPCFICVSLRSEERWQPTASHPDDTRQAPWDARRHQSKLVNQSAGERV